MCSIAIFSCKFKREIFYGYKFRLSRNSKSLDEILDLDKDLVFKFTFVVLFQVKSEFF